MITIKFDLPTRLKHLKLKIENTIISAGYLAEVVIEDYDNDGDFARPIDYEKINQKINNEELAEQAEKMKHAYSFIQEKLYSIIEN